MPNLKSSIKRVRSSERRKMRNLVFRGGARTAVKRARLLIDSGKHEEAQEAVRLAASALDKAASKGIIHKNNAARRKSRLEQRLAQARQSSS